MKAGFGEMKKRLLLSVLTEILTLTSFILINLFNMNTTSADDVHSIDLDFYHLFRDHRSIMMLIDEDTGDIIHVNQAAADFYGYSVEELESMKAMQLSTLSPEETGKVMRMIAAEWRNNFTFNHRLANGEIRTLEVYSCPHNAEGKTILFSIIHDITAETRLAEKNRMLNTVYITILIGMISFMALLSFMLLKRIGS